MGTKITINEKIEKLDNDLETLRASIEILKTELRKDDDEYDRNKAKVKINGAYLWVEEVLDRLQEVQKEIHIREIKITEDKL